MIISPPKFKNVIHSHSFFSVTSKCNRIKSSTWNFSVGKENAYKALIKSEQFLILPRFYKKSSAVKVSNVVCVRKMLTSRKTVEHCDLWVISKLETLLLIMHVSGSVGDNNSVHQWLCSHLILKTILILFMLQMVRCFQYF